MAFGWFVTLAWGDVHMTFSKMPGIETPSSFPVSNEMQLGIHTTFIFSFGPSLSPFALDVICSCSLKTGSDQLRITKRIWFDPLVRRQVKQMFSSSSVLPLPLFLVVSWASTFFLFACEANAPFASLWATTSEGSCWSFACSYHLIALLSQRPDRLQNR